MFCAIALSLLIQYVHSSSGWQPQTEQNILSRVAGRWISAQGIKAVQFRQAHVNELLSPKDTEAPGTDTASAVCKPQGAPGLMVSVIRRQSKSQRGCKVWRFWNIYLAGIQPGNLVKVCSFKRRTTHWESGVCSCLTVKKREVFIGYSMAVVPNFFCLDCFFFIKLVFNNVCYTVLQINGSPISAKSDILFSLIACTVWVGFLWAPVKKPAVLDQFFTIIDPTCGLNRFLSLHEAHQLPPQPWKH